MRNSIIAASVLTVVLVVSPGCNNQIKEWTATALEEAKRIAKQEGSRAAEERVEQAKKELADRGIAPEQIDSIAKLLVAYMQKHDSQKGPVDYELILNLAIAYLGLNYAKKKMGMGAAPAQPINGSH